MAVETMGEYLCRTGVCNELPVFFRMVISYANISKIEHIYGLQESPNSKRLYCTPKQHLLAPVATQEFFRGEGGSKNSVEDRGQRERGSRVSSPLVRGAVQFANE
jgi:hypothetical protein